MSFIHSLLGNYPPARAEGAGPWLRAQVFEGVSSAGPWTLVHDPGNFTTPDPDPENPGKRDFTFDTDTEFAWYLIKFFDVDSNEASLKPIFDGPSFRPSVRDVAKKILSRTKSAGGVYQGTFNENTTVKPEWVEEQIDDGMSKVIMKMGTDLDVDQQAFASEMAALYAAMMIELSFYSEQIDNERSPYREFKELWNDWFEDDTEDYPVGEEGGPTNQADFNFPPTVPLRW